MMNGLTKALAAVAIACLGYQAFAVAPVVSQIPSPVVTDDSGVTGGTPVGVSDPYLFVYVDWINLLNFVSDDGDPAAIVWSFTSASDIADGAGGVGDYSFNAARSLDLGTENPVTPPTAAIINTAANLTAAGEYNTDASVLTPTVRDISLSPFGGPNVTTGTLAGELLNMDTITLFASDGTTFGQRSFIAFTESSGGVNIDRLSATPVPTPVNVANINFAAGTSGWVFLPGFGTTVSSTVGGICINVPLTGTNTGEWVSPYGAIQLVDNNVWRLRFTMSTTATAAGTVPLWDIILQNIDRTLAVSADHSYLADYFFWDNAGSANAIAGPAQGRNTFEVWYTPSAVKTGQWRNGAFTTTNEPLNDMQLHFRVLDADGASVGELDAGTICVTNLVIDRFDLDNLLTDVQEYLLDPISPGISGVSVTSVADASSSNFGVNPLTITPTNPAGWQNSIASVTPGDTNNPDVTSGSYTEAAIADNFPIIHQSNTLYKLEVAMSAPDANSETRGPDGVRLGMDLKTNEVLAESYYTTGMGFVGAPKTVATAGGAQTYTMFFYGHSTTQIVGPTGAARVRPRVDVLSAATYNRPTSTDVNNTGGVRIHSIRVSRVAFFGQ
jgi:hypothetical protein